MENQKDTTQKQGGQIQGQLTQAHNTVNVLKSVNDFDEINQEISYSFLCKKTEKLATALYLITGFLSDNEPIKWSVRSSGLSVLSDVTDLGNSVVSEMSQKVKKIMSDIEKTVSLLEIAATAGFVSEMNLAILREEYLSLVQTLAARKRGGLQESFVFSRDFFSVRGIPRKENEEIYKGHIKDTTSPQPVRPSPGRVSDPVRNVSSVTRPSDFSTPSQMPTLTSVGSGKVLTDTSNTVGITNATPKKLEKESRKETIISLIRSKGPGGELSIKDITAHFTDCGEKTIQRELAALVAEKVLKKTGDRRWSKYSLV
ncbi:MAG: hypothetical protein M0P76_00085 [Candidatus Pacebacteria bacterium]|jgi:hypothetical protein|nr:hypothetical protein [Candidatus Paceibacterota bacterium]